METNELEILRSTIREEVLRIDGKWISKKKNIRIIIAGEWKFGEELPERYEGFISDIAKLIPLESENSELIASILSEVSGGDMVSFTFFWMIRYLFSTGEVYNLKHYVDEIPIIWNPVESGGSVNRSGT